MADPRPVLVVTELDDPTADGVIAELARRDVPVVRLDPGDFPAEVTFAASVGAGRRWNGRIRTPSRDAGLDPRSLYHRRPRPYVFAHLDGPAARFAAAQATQGLGGVLATLPNCLYVNHPARIRAAEAKPAQLDAAVRLGFEVPATLITNDLASALQFADTHRRVVHKPMTAAHLDVDAEPWTVWVEEIGREELDTSVAATAHMFQSRVDHVAFVRVTVIGPEVFCVRIDSPELDWRRAYERLAYSVLDPPLGLRQRLLAYLGEFGLVFGAFDFALDQAGEWVLLECNPNGQWSWLETETGLPMTAALAGLLERGVG